MAKPRVFVSSTFYDLRQVRADIERFIKELGYEPILNESGNIPYGKDKELEEYCYSEITNVDILVSIIGGRYGSDSQQKNFSVSQMELKAALENNRQVYIFIEKNVKAEYQTFLVNKETPEFKCGFADNIKIYEFIEYIDNLPNNNIISAFETSQDIIFYLKEQWAGLFQRFLKEQPREKEINLIKGIETTANTLNQLVSFLTADKKESDVVIRDILLSNHPAMEQMRELLKVTYRVFFTTIEEMNAWLSVRRFNYQFDFDENDYLTYIRIDKKNNLMSTLTIKKEIFNADGKLKIYTKNEWRADFFSINETEIEPSIDDEDILSSFGK